jgi:hypothetical protein
MHLASKEISDQAMAYREAGYTVACWSLGFRVKRATISLHGKPSEFLTWLKAARFSCNSGLSRRSIVRYHDRIVCALAGLQAQRRVALQSVRSRDANCDEATAAELLLRLHGEEKEASHAFRYLQARARNLVSNPINWRRIEDLAKALLERQTLTGKEVKKVLAGSLQAQMQEART